MAQNQKKIFGIVGHCGGGKTGLVDRLIAHFVGAGHSISVVRRVFDDFDFDEPGKDSYRQREAGAQQVLLTNSKRWTMMQELRGAPEPDPLDYVKRLDPCDFVLAIGYKNLPIAKLEILVPASGKPPLFPDDANIIGVVTEHPLKTALPIFRPDEIEAIAGFVAKHAGLNLR